MGDEGVEKFVSTPELKSEDQIDHDPLPPVASLLQLVQEVR